jgi:hypothetical protein
MKEYKKEQKALKAAQRVEKKQEKEAAKAERKEIWKNGTAKEKRKNFFFGQFY